MTGMTTSVADDSFNGGISGADLTSDSRRTSRQPLGALSSFATDRLHSAADEGKQQLVNTLDGLVQAAEEFAGKLQGSAGGPVADIASRAADLLRDWQASIETKSVEDLLEDGRDLIRSSPAVAMGAAVATGFLLSRILKASAGTR